MAEYDLTPVISQYLDRHLVFPLLEFLQFCKLYDDVEVQKAKYELLLDTNMVDFAIEIQEKLYPERPTEELMAKRSVVVSRLKQLQADAAPIEELFNKEEVQEQIKTLTRDSNMLLEYLKREHGFQGEALETVYNYAKFLYDCGSYPEAEEWLYHYYILSDSPEKTFSALWGKFASAILMQNWEVAYEDFERLKAYIDPKDGKNPGTPLQQLQQRTWLIHWCLFVFFNHPKGRDGIVDLFLMTPQYANAIQTVCPHILRYITAAVITNKRRRSVLRDLVKVIQQESYTYRDPITEFLECLYVNFDFDGAQQKLRECETVLSNDFFLVACRDDFVENARLFIFETYCRIHNTISISMLAEKLNMDGPQAEQWIVNLIRNAKLDAKLDSKEGNVVMATQVPSIYHQVIEKTKSLNLRSTMLTDNIEKKIAGAARPTHEFV